ncbi:MAG: mannose-1-phosphate guanylyltransferase/mannose-6-phosphate isomerase [Nitrospirota bacterium]|nr:mannose-1-phosphate guanylyltransferase/mannose-6-phosphate isomerase [Nitrospirota bacterium]
MKALILAGGSGTRLWPLSRKNYPKQFLKLNSKSSFLQKTAERLLNVVSIDDIIVMTNSEYKFHVLADLNAIFNNQHSISSPGHLPFANIVLEPVSRNTAPAIALGIKYCVEKLGCKEDEVLFISPSDHVIKPADRFAEYIRLSEDIAKKGYMVTFGIKPTRPETGYGYIQVSKESAADSKHSEDIRNNYFKVEEFTEKPDTETAKKYVKEGNYYWNSGMFAFCIGTIIEEFSRHAPKISEMLDMSFDELVSNFKQMPDISLDYAVAEKSERIVILPLDLYWNDIGSWDSLYDVLDKNGMGNIKMGDVFAIDTKDTLIISNKRFVSTIGLEDCLIVDTDDALLIAKKGETQKVREIVNKLKEDDRKEALEHVTTYRPWGSYTVLEEGERYKIKRVVVNPSERLSLQLHHHRSEHWVVIKGTAKVTIGDLEKLVHENESVYIPELTRHRLENPGKVPLEIIEVQNGEYVGEDDIERIDDTYGRE